MNRYRKLATKMLEAHPELPSLEMLPQSLQDYLVDTLVSIIELRFGTPVLPTAGETVAISMETPRTAALFFDRIWHPPVMDKSVPQEIIVYGATETEVWPLAVMIDMTTTHGPDWQKVKEVFGSDTPIADLWAHRETPAARTISEVLARERGIKAIPIYESMESWEQDYRLGSSEVIVAALQGMNIINESGLGWEQVMEFRQDAVAKAKLRRLRHWLDSTMFDKPLTYIRDELAIRLDDYEWALKKHGIETVTGTAAELLDPRFLTGVGVVAAGLHLAGADFWAAVGAAGAIVGRVALSITTRLVDLADANRTDSEVAVIHEVKQLSAGGKLRNRPENNRS